MGAAVSVLLTISCCGVCFSCSPLRGLQAQLTLVLMWRSLMGMSSQYWLPYSKGWLQSCPLALAGWSQTGDLPVSVLQIPRLQATATATCFGKLCSRFAKSNATNISYILFWIYYVYTVIHKMSYNWVIALTFMFSTVQNNMHSLKLIQSLSWLYKTNFPLSEVICWYEGDRSKLEIRITHFNTELFNGLK